MKNFELIANGFLPTRGSWMLDFVSVAMLVVLATMAISIYLVRVQKNKSLHRMLQITTAVVLTVAIICFEIDVRFFTQWREIAAPSPFYDSGVVDTALFVHLCFAIPTPLFWGYVIVIARRRFKVSFDQGAYNRIHRICGWIAAVMMTGTAVTGWVFYYLAFVA